MQQQNIKKGISFIRLIPFLTMDFKEKLADGKLDIREYFKLESEVAYKTLLAIIRDDVESNKVKKPKKSWFKRVIS